MSIAKNFSFLTAGSIVEKILKFSVIIIIARYLDIAEFGQYSFTISFVGLFMHLLDGGFNLLLLREIPKRGDKKEEILGNVLGAKLIVGPVVLIFIVLIAMLLRYSSGTVICVFIYGLSMLIFTFSKSFMNMFIAIHRAELECGLITGYSIFLFTGITVCCLFFYAHIFWIMAVYLISNIFMVYTGCLISKKISILPVINIKKTRISELIKDTIPFALGAIMGEIFFNIDNVMISKISGMAPVGFYNIAYRLSYVGVLLANSLTLAAYPYISKEWEHDKKAVYMMFERLFYIIIVFSVIFCIVATLFSDKIIIYFFGSEYEKSVVLFKILVWSLPPLCIMHLTGRTLEAVGKQHLTAASMVISVCINIILNYCLIISFGALGASIATVISSIMIVMIQVYYLQTRAEFSFRNFHFYGIFSTLLC